jgi:hypothetical protein
MRVRYKINFHPEAQVEYLEAAKWYEDSLLGLGIIFVEEVERTLDIIEKNPNTYPLKKHKFREANVNKISICCCI